MSDSPSPRKAKVCMLGAAGVGKTSLVARFVHSIFSEKYLTTIGVKIDKKSIDVDDQSWDLVLWDLAGEDDFQTVRMSYLKGAAGFLLVVDGTRVETFETAIELQQRATQEVGPLPFEVVVNKLDLADDWQIGADELERLAQLGWSFTSTSAKTGEKVEQVFGKLVRHMAQV